MSQAILDKSLQLNPWAIDRPLQLVFDKSGATCLVTIRSITDWDNEAIRVHGSPLTSEKIKTTELVDYLNGFAGIEQVKGYREYGGRALRIRGVQLEPLNKTNIKALAASLCMEVV